jgi:group I intron endonuclease
MNEEKQFFIYKITNIINNKIYIGQTDNPNKRWAGHRGVSKTCKHYLYKSIRKYGIENFIFEIIAQTIKLEYIDELEIVCIKQYNCTNPIIGYNIESGGGRIKKAPMSNEVKLKISKGHIGKKVSQDTKIKLSKAAIGKKHTEETKAKMRKKDKKPKKKYEIIYPNITNKRLSEETKQKLREANLGKKASEDTLIKMSKSMIGKNKGKKNGMYGIPSEKTPLAKLTQDQANEIRERYSSEKISSIQLAKEYDVSKKTILNIINNKTYIIKK